MTTAETTAMAPGAPEWSTDETVMARLTRSSRRTYRRRSTRFCTGRCAPIRPQRRNDLGAPDTVNRKHYHMKWKRDPVFAAALDAVYKAALRSHNQRALDAVRLAASRLQLASPAAAGTAIRSMAADDPNIALRAALAILDRAGWRPHRRPRHAIGPTPF